MTWIVSEGTLRTADLIPKFLDALYELSPAAYEQIVTPANGFTMWHNGAIYDSEHEWWLSESAEDALSMLFGALNELAPEGMYFDSQEGDAACYGFWQCEEE